MSGWWEVDAGQAKPTDANEKVTSGFPVALQ